MKGSLARSCWSFLIVQPKDLSLNQVLMQWPDLVNNLVGVLRLRRESIALVADIESMLHQVYVAPRDRDCLRFFWWPGGDISKDPVICRMKVHLFGAMSSPSVERFAYEEMRKILVLSLSLS